MSTPVVYSKAGCIAYATVGALTIGSETRPVHAPGWTGEQSTGGRSVLAFSLLPIRIEFADNDPTILSPSVVAVTVPNGMYQRKPATAQGQRTIFLTIPRWAWDGLGTSGASALPSRDAPSCPGALAMARVLERYAFAEGRDPEPLFLEETAARIIDRSLGVAVRSARARAIKRTEASTHRLQRELVNATISRLHEDATRRWSLSELADDVELSPAYLSRLVRQHTGLTITRALTIARVAMALERLPDERGSLARLALECGFGSHARMTEVFTTLLGVSPSALATKDTRGQARALRSLARSV